MIYFAHDPTTDLVKIGEAQNVELRIQRLGYTHPGVRLLVAAPSGRFVEGNVHASLDADRVHGEWFRFSDAVANLIEAIRDGRFDVRSLPRRKSPALREKALAMHARRRAQAEAA